MELFQIRYFLAVCEVLNFTKAAEHCNVTQPSLTRAIQNLEHEFGGLLFIRGRAGATLTTLGETMRQELALVQSHANSARAAAQGWAKGTQGILRVGVSTAAGPTRVACFLGTFQTRHKGVTLVISEGSCDDLLTQLNRSSIDAALVEHPRVMPPRQGVHWLYEERLVVMVPARHEFAKLDSVPMSRVAEERILLSTHRDMRNNILPILKGRGIAVAITCHSSRDEFLIGMVAEGAGIAIVPEGLPLPPSVTTRPLAEPAQRQSIHLVLDGDASAKAIVGMMADFAAQYPTCRPGPFLARAAIS